MESNPRRILIVLPIPGVLLLVAGTARSQETFPTAAL